MRDEQSFLTNSLQRQEKDEIHKTETNIDEKVVNLFLSMWSHREGIDWDKESNVTLSQVKIVKIIIINRSIL